MARSRTTTISDYLHVDGKTCCSYVVDILYCTESVSVAEPVEPKLIYGAGAVLSYFGNGPTAPEPKLFIKKIITVPSHTTGAEAKK